MRESEAFKLIILNSMPEHIAVLNEQGVIVTVNAAWQRFAEENSGPNLPKSSVGLNYRDVCFSTIGESLGEEASEAWYGIEEVLTGKRNHFTLEYACDSPQESRWFQMTVNPLSGPYKGAVVAHADISVRKQAELALRESQRQNEILARILETSNQPFGVGYPDGCIGLINRAFELLTGYNGDELRSVDWSETLTPREWLDIEQEKLEELRRTGQPVRYEKEYIRKDGSRVPIELLVHRMVDASGKLEYYYSFLTDISERKQAEEKLRQERLFLRQVIDATPSLIFVKDLDGRIVMCNDAFAQCYATTPEALIGKTNDEFNPHPDETMHYLLCDKEIFKSGQIRYFPEEKATHADGSVHWFSTVKLPLLNPNGQYDKLLGVATDITVRKQVEETLAKQTIQLREQANQLIETDRRKDEFLAMLGHELRNPLTPIMIAAQLLKKRGAQDASLVDWASSTIEHQCVNLTQLVNQLLDISRATQGKIFLQKTPIDLGELISQAVQSSKPLIDKHRHELLLDLSHEPLFIDADPVRLEQIIGNLLNNSAKYTPDGGKILIELARETGEAVIRIRDNGIGISSGMLPKVFDLFTQAERTLDRAQGGLGIGLALVKRLVELHGGSVMAISEGIGMGSEFLVRLPLLIQATYANITRCAVVSKTNSIPVRRVLVVDDRDDVLASFVMLLNNMGQIVHHAGNGMEALTIAMTVPLDIVLLDIGMPGMDGYEVANKIRENPKLNKLKLIAMTGYGHNHGQQESFKACFDRYLVKPIARQELEMLLVDFV